VNTSGTSNSAFGAHALLLSSKGSYNSAFGFDALSSLTLGSYNTASGEGALSSLASGDYNTAIGTDAGTTLQNGSDNIYIGFSVVGGVNESDTIRIGDSGHTAAFIGGIYGSTSASGTNVFVNSSGQLGTATSSRRYKQDIADLGVESDVLLKLRPVAFYYKPELDETHTRQYGLVAEEVAQIAPGLVLFDKDGKPQTVRYHFVNAMLLNEVQKQRRLIETQRKDNEEQKSLNAAQQKQLAAQQRQIETQQTQLEALQKQIAGLVQRVAQVEQGRPQLARVLR
jgi:hypothetical protein